MKFLKRYITQKLSLLIKKILKSPIEKFLISKFSHVPEKYSKIKKTVIRLKEALLD